MDKNTSSFYFPAPRSQKFCSQCASPLSKIIPPDDNCLRDVCNNCGAVHYQNPLNVVGVLPIFNDKVLLCRRAIQPRYNTWTLPAGFMELDETSAQGAVRETHEEAGAEIKLGQLYTVIDVPHANQIHFFYLAQVLSEKLFPGPESLEADFFALDDIPWDKLSFRTVVTTLEHYINDVKNGAQPGCFPIRNYHIQIDKKL